MLCVYKPLGITPLQAIMQLKMQQPELRNQKISYAGRLDPMAEGLLLLLVGDVNKKRHEYEAMRKTYEFEVLFGISTDTYDTLGFVTNHIPLSSQFPLSTKLSEILPTFIGTRQQAYPPYSSMTVDGKPLYAWAREGKIAEIVLPTHDITITSLSLVAETTLSPALVEKTVQERITKVHGDFRQDAIRSSWHNFINSSPLSDFPVAKLRITCSSGTYIRSLADELGKQLGTAALAYAIKRTEIGHFTLTDALSLNL